ncbi:hypothetical protein Salat_2953400 [Sesamum alatum]|uniref:Pectinesterase inhibitor domain-containing protein n=1 Tax=Sesamum alatum TaxID=300844 RepID=A0AAE1XJH6_9LAMI|nr:hypothetical protein Salat_2953400 [Sesamum alatum]
MADFLSLAPLAFILCLVLILSSIAAAAAGTTELATQICRNTSNYAFCQEAMYSDPRAVGADRYLLAYIAYRQAYLNATDTADYIASELKSKSMESGGASGSLRKCLGYYEEAIRRLAEMLGNLDSETFYGLDELSIDVENSVRGCQASVGNPPSPLSKRNDDLIKLSNICLVVSKLYIYL